MPIPRLKPSANPFSLSFNVNERLRPYFEIWFQTDKEAGESPDEFAFRMLKTAAKNFHIQRNIKPERDAIEQAKIDKTAEVEADIIAFSVEID